MNTTLRKLLVIVLLVAGLSLGALGVAAAAEVFGNAGGSPASSVAFNWDGLSVDFTTTAPGVTVQSVSINIGNQQEGDAVLGWSILRYDPISNSYSLLFDWLFFTVPSGVSGWIDVPLPGAVTLPTVDEYAVLIYYAECEECSSNVSWLTSSSAPSGGSLLQYVGSWDETAGQYIPDHLFIEMSVVAADPNVCSLPVPAGSVVGEAPHGAQVYYAPGNMSPGIRLNPGTYVVIGQDATETYYKIILACQYLWVLKTDMQPSLQPPQNGAPLPTRIVS